MNINSENAVALEAVMNQIPDEQGESLPSSLLRHMTGSPRVVMDCRHHEFFDHCGVFGASMMMSPMPASNVPWLKRPELMIVGPRSKWCIQKKVLPGTIIVSDGKTHVDCGNNVEITFLDWIPRAHGHKGTFYDFYSSGFREVVHAIAKNCRRSFIGPELLLSVNNVIARWFCCTNKARYEAIWIARWRRGQLTTERRKFAGNSPISVDYYVPKFIPGTHWSFMSQFMPMCSTFPTKLPGRLHLDRT